VLVFDRSGSMATAGKLRSAQDAAVAFLDAVDFTQSRVALVPFNSTAALEQPLTDDAAALRSTINRLTAAGGTNISLPLEIAAGELSGPRRRPTAVGVIILLTDGNDNAGPWGPTIAALEAKLDGSRVFAIGLGDDVNDEALRRMASVPDDYYFAPAGDQLEAIYRDIARRIRAELLLRTLTVSDRLPPDMTYLGMVRGPEPLVDRSRLVWTLSDIGFEGLELVYRVRPTRAGYRATNVEASAEYVDGLGHRDRRVFPVPHVSVLAPAAGPVTATAPPTASPAPSPTPRPVTVYLPVSLRDHCRPSARHADVVLVLDASTSMLQLTRSGRSKLQAAVDAADEFVGRLRLPHDQVGLVAFNRDAALLAPLGSGAAAVRASLGAMRPAEGTRIDLGLGRAAAELAGPRRRAGNTPVVVVLTDGLPNGSTHEQVLASARAARAAGARVFAIGLGADVDMRLLAGVASEPGDLFYAPDGDDLAAIYRAIAFEIPCR
jgi:Mg-chelatase subunit ChlD